MARPSEVGVGQNVQHQRASGVSPCFHLGLLLPPPPHLFVASNRHRALSQRQRAPQMETHQSSQLTQWVSTSTRVILRACPLDQSSGGSFCLPTLGARSEGVHVVPEFEPKHWLPSHQLTWVCAQTPVERLLSSWKGPFCTSMIVRGRVGVLFGGFGQKIEGDSWFTWWFNHLIIYQGHLFPLKGRLCLVEFDSPRIIVILGEEARGRQKRLKA